MKKVLLILLYSLCSIASAENYPVDSTDLHPPNITFKKQKSFVLTTGTFQILCYNEKSVCLHQVPTSTCPIGYRPVVSTSVAYGGNGHGIKNIYLQGATIINSSKQYWIQFSQAYVSNTNGANTPLGVSYTIYCT